jgi:hypothetical protein
MPGQLATTEILTRATINYYHVGSLTPGQTGRLLVGRKFTATETALSRLKLQLSIGLGLSDK